MKTIAVIEDDSDLYSLLEYKLGKEGFAIVGLQTGKGALDLCRQKRPDLLLLDIMLPDVDGWEICKAIRRSDDLEHLPIIFLTSRASESDRILGLELGANDYIVKPFSFQELITRVKVHLRDRQPPNLLKTRDLELDAARCRVRVGGQEILLTATEFRLLEFLMSRPGIVFSRERLLGAAWHNERTVTARTVDVYVLRLRKKIEAASGWSLIRSVRGFGYAFDHETTEITS